MYTVIVADDQEQICEGIAALLAQEFPDLKILGTYRNGTDVISALAMQLADIVITDIRMPGVDGLEICRYIREHSSDAQIILISAYTEFEWARKAIDYKCLTYLVKPYAPSLLIDAIHGALENLENRGFDTASKRKEANGNEVPTTHDWVVSVEEFIRKHYTNPSLSLEAISDHFHVSRGYLSNMFKQHTGLFVPEYLNNVRLEKAKALLRDSNMTNEAIAIAVGYNSASYFHRIFKKRFSISPMKFRRKAEH